MPDPYGGCAITYDVLFRSATPTALDITGRQKRFGNETSEPPFGAGNECDFAFQCVHDAPPRTSVPHP